MQAANAIEAHQPMAVEKLRRATQHGMRHSQAGHALACGVELTAVRDDLCHASIATYLRGNEIQRVRQMWQPLAPGNRPL